MQIDFDELFLKEFTIARILNNPLYPGQAKKRYFKDLIIFLE